MPALQQLPPEVIHLIYQFIDLNGLKCLRSTCEDIKSSVDDFSNSPNRARDRYCEVKDVDSGMQLSLCPPTFAHTTLVVDIPTLEEFKGFYKLDLETYLSKFSKNMKSLECNWFCGFSTREEFSFLNSFDGLQELIFQNVNYEPESDLVLNKVPSCVLNISYFRSPWSPLFTSLGWLKNPGFKPKSLLFTDISGDHVLDFFEQINNHIILRLQRNDKLSFLAYDEDCIRTDIEFPGGLLKEFCQNVIKTQLGLNGVSLVFLYMIEKVLDMNEFLEFLKCLDIVNGFHPLMRKLQLDRLEDAEIRIDPMKIDDLRWTKQGDQTYMPNLVKMGLQIKISDESFRQDRSTERKIAQNIMDAVLGSLCPKLKKLKVEILKPDWYPLYVPIDSYVKNFENLESIKIGANLSSIQVNCLFKALASCKITKIELSNCYITDESFKDNAFLQLTDLNWFSIRTQNYCSMHFLSDETFFNVFSRCELSLLHLTGDFPLITSNGIRFLTYGEHVAETLCCFEFDTKTISLDMKKALDSVQRICDQNVSRREAESLIR